MKHRAFVAITAALVGAVPNHAAAQSGSAAVNTMMSTYLAGANTYTTTVFGGGGISPFLVALNPGTARVLTVSATGTATFCPGATCGTPGPDGPSIGGTNLNASGKISGILASTSGFLAGVFLSASLPTSAPASLNFTNLDFLSLAPLLGQQFFIGDGVTSTNVTQQFFVPDGADFLYLGIADGSSFNGDPGFYDDNVGTYTARYNVAAVTSTPEPSTVVLMFTGLAAVGIVRRKRAQ